MGFSGPVYWEYPWNPLEIRGSGLVFIRIIPLKSGKKTGFRKPRLIRPARWSQGARVVFLSVFVIPPPSRFSPPLAAPRRQAAALPRAAGGSGVSEVSLVSPETWHSGRNHCFVCS